MKKKIFSILAIMLFVLISMTNVQAADGLFTTKMYTDIFKLSEQSEKIELPFLNLFEKAVTYDEIITHSGITMADSTVDVNEKLEGVQMIFSTDMVTIKGEVENALLYGNNVVVEGKITGDSLIIAPTVKILENAVISKDVIIIANNLEIKGTVEGNLIATVTEKASVTGVIKEDLRMITYGLTIDEATIDGDIYLETNIDVTSIKEKYPNAVVKPIVEETTPKIDWVGMITNGIITVIIYTAICFFVTRKENNVAEKAYNKFKAHSVYGIVLAFILFVLVLVLPLALLLLAIAGLGIIAWPLLIAYIALMLLVWSISMLIVGTTIFEAVKAKVGKYKLLAMVVIFAVLFALTQITYIAFYASLSMYIIALAIVITMLTRKLPKEV